MRGTCCFSLLVSYCSVPLQTHYFQPPSVCVNAAGITQDDFLLNMEEDHFDRVIQVNLKGSFLITQAVAQALVACGAPKGSIITVGSIVGKVRELQRDAF
ncbi:(3R)-3-hydroxyacyl-CoA dehydrogenase-like [Labrus mixtus]|uniref:(3R)-3-hydroxyacyl-CoA dehydrogenase-like n=1 Tax=Labrus mixtus TaxID=508554 RepID=UPI0029C0973C|nr:(3R)-3-hydroxyacyl-CoA dehydrogenase-like [Labrus mixtus]